jgi:hypothetical protein
LAFGGFLGGLANLGTVAGGAQDYQRRDVMLRTALQELAQKQRAEQLQKALAAGQSSFLANQNLEELHKLFGTPATPSAPTQAGYAPGAVQQTPLDQSLPPVPSYGLNSMRDSGTAPASGTPSVTAPWATGLRPEFAGNLNDMFAGAKAAGVDLGPGSGFRTADRQRELYQQDVAQHGGTPSGMVAPPGRSMHQYGGAEDVTSGGRLVRGGAPDRWLAQHVGEYGLRRPMAYEPWHIEMANEVNPTPQGKALAKVGAAATVRSIPPQAFGRIDDVFKLARLVEKQNPGADPEVKMGIVTNLFNLMSKSGQLAYQTWWEQHKFEATEEDKKLVREETAARDRETEEYHKLRAAQGGVGGWQIVQQDGKTYRVRPSTGESAEMPQLAGATRLGSAPKPSPLTDANAEYYANIFKVSGGWLPPGIARNQAAIAQILNKTGSTMSPEDFIANQATKKADAKSLARMTMLTDTVESYERTVIDNFNLALKYAKEQGGIPGNWGPWFNHWIATGRIQFGDEKVPAYIAALRTAADEYAKVLTGSTGAAASTEGARRETAELFSPYYNLNQIEEVIEVAKAEMENRTGELRRTRDAIKDRLRQVEYTGPVPPGHERPPTRDSGGTKTPGDSGRDIYYDLQGNRIP